MAVEPLPPALPMEELTQSKGLTEVRTNRTCNKAQSRQKDSMVRDIKYNRKRSTEDLCSVHKS